MTIEVFWILNNFEFWFVITSIIAEGDVLQKWQTKTVLNMGHMVKSYSWSNVDVY